MSEIISQPKELIAAFVNTRQGLDPLTPWVEPYSTLGLMREGRLVAGVVYNFLDGANVCMHIGAEEGGHWATPEFLLAVFDYPFNQLGRRRVTAMTKKRAKKTRAFVENLGFTYEGKCAHYFSDDDLIVYGMLRANCRFLDMRKAA
jgi:RimJ/RimL family protein N-acetyltransferase